MAQSTQLSPEERKAKIAELRKKHQHIFDAMGIPDAYFIPKMAYLPKSGVAEKIIAMFPSELKSDFYTEFVDINYESEDPQRELWKWNFNPQFDTEYEKSPPHPVSGHVRSFIPVGELVLVTEVKPSTSNLSTKSVMEEFTLNDPDQDLPLDQMTIRDVAALLLKKPVSKKKWLNDLIKS